jgi:hypothetical protein
MMLWGAEDFARARARLGEMDETRLSGERARLDMLASLVEPRDVAARSCSAISGKTRPKPAAIATIASNLRRSPM